MPIITYKEDGVQKKIEGSTLRNCIGQLEGSQYDFAVNNDLDIIGTAGFCATMQHKYNWKDVGIVNNNSGCCKKGCGCHE